VAAPKASSESHYRSSSIAGFSIHPAPDPRKSGCGSARLDDHRLKFGQVFFGFPLRITPGPFQSISLAGSRVLIFFRWMQSESFLSNSPGKSLISAGVKWESQAVFSGAGRDAKDWNGAAEGKIKALDLSSHILYI